MGVTMRKLIGRQVGSLRLEPTAKRVRARLGGQVVADTTEARLVWEPRRVVPTYAVPESSLRVDLRPAGPPEPAAGDGVGLAMPEVSARPVLDPTVPFAVHTAEGVPLDVLGASQHRAGAAFRPEDADLAGYVVLDFDAFDWLEEEERIVSHPRDPFHRVDILRSDRHVRIELDGVLLAESTRALLLFETLLPVRFYLPADDVAVELSPSDTISYCAYKGQASYFSLPDGEPDLAWTYREPLLDAVPVRDRIAFFDERLDVVLDGEPRPRPVTPWSRRAPEHPVDPTSSGPAGLP